MDLSVMQQLGLKEAPDLVVPFGLLCVSSAQEIQRGHTMLGLLLENANRQSTSYISEHISVLHILLFRLGAGV